MQVNRSIEPRTQQTFREFKQALERIVPSAGPEISPNDRLDAIVAKEQRQRVWQELRAAGWELPELVRSAGVVFLAALLISAAVAFVALFLRTWSALLVLLDWSWLARKLTQPLAVHPPVACETVREAVLHLTPFRREDYQAGLWPREELAAKVRLIISKAAGVPFAQIRDDSKLCDLFDC
jgi:hypothetical protein